MVPENNSSEKKIDEFVSRIREAAKTNLVSVIVFGSAAAGDFHPEFSNLNLFCVVRDSSFAALQALAPVAKWWDKQKQPPPLFMTRDEIEHSADVFSIELMDMKQHHRLVFGEDVLKDLAIPMALHRVQVEYELREKLSLLRQHLLLASGDDARMWQLLMRSVSSFVTLVPARAHRAGPWMRRWESARPCRPCRSRSGSMHRAVLHVLDVREGKVERKQVRRGRCVRAISGGARTSDGIR